MVYYRAVGDLPAKRHTQFRSSADELYSEELISHDGFDRGSLLYHCYPPTGIVSAEPADVPLGGLHPQKPLRPRLFQTHDLDANGDLVLDRHLLFGNGQVSVSYAVANSPSELYRSSVGDEVVFIESGAASLESVFGNLEVTSGDCVVLPSGTTHRWIPVGTEPIRALIVDCVGHVAPPRRYRSDSGQFREGAPYAERDLRAPNQVYVKDDEPATVLVRHHGGFTRYAYEHHPFDVIGWDGYVWPFAFNIKDFEPIVGRYHQPPPVSQIFEGPGYVMCAFVPRPHAFGPDAIKVPYNHHNVDCDEAIFYVNGDFMSRKGSRVKQGSISLHPPGFIHGPHPGSIEASMGITEANDYAIMVDFFKPLMLSANATQVEVEDYAWSWSSKRSGLETQNEAGGQGKLVSSANEHKLAR